MKYAWRFSYFLKNAGKRCNSYFSTFIDFNLVLIMIIPDIF